MYKIYLLYFWFYLYYYSFIWEVSNVSFGVGDWVGIIYVYVLCVFVRRIYFVK